MVEVSLRRLGSTTVVGIGGANVDAELLGRVVEGAGAFDSPEPLVIDLTAVAVHSPACVREVLDGLERQGVADGVAVVWETSSLDGWSSDRPAWLHTSMGSAVAAVGAGDVPVT